MGGFNIGKEYIDKDPKFGHWRDTHMRITGSSVTALEARFILDWNFADRKRLLSYEDYMDNLKMEHTGRSPIQIITSGPDSHDEYIRNTYVRMIHKARKSIYIQTPYFIPDESMMTALQIAIHSGVEVNIDIRYLPNSRIRMVIAVDVPTAMAVPCLAPCTTRSIRRAPTFWPE